MKESDAPDTTAADDLSTLYKASPQPTPPAAFGEQLRQSARDAVQTPARPAWRSHHGLAVAAVVVLSAAILLLLPREQLNLPGDAQREIEAPPPATLDLPPEPAAPAKRSPAREDLRRLQPAEESLDRAAPGVASPVPLPPDGAVDLPRPAESPPAAEAEADGVLEQSYYRGSPELWISHIERLLSEGRLTDAKREFDAFKERHPQHPFAAQR